MQSKFSLLPIGQRFTYQGTSYVKVSPLIASAGEGGAQRMIPRSAMVEVAEAGQQNTPKGGPSPLAPAQVIAAFDASRDWLLTQLPTPSPELVTLLDGQRQRFLEALSPGDDNR